MVVGIVVGGQFAYPMRGCSLEDVIRDREARVLRLLGSGETWTARQVGVKLDVSKAVAQRTLADLRRRGLVEHVLAEPGAHYWLAGFRIAGGKDNHAAV